MSHFQSGSHCPTVFHCTMSERGEIDSENKGTYDSEEEIVVWVRHIPDRCEGETLKLGIDERRVVRVAVVHSEAAQLHVIDEGEEGYVSRGRDGAVEHTVHRNGGGGGIEGGVSNVGRIYDAEQVRLPAHVFGTTIIGMKYKNRERTYN